MIAEVADIPERNFSFVTRKNFTVKYNVETLVNGRAEQDYSKQFDPEYKKSMHYYKSFVHKKSNKREKKDEIVACLGWHSGRSITGSNPFKLFVLIFRCAPIDETIAAL